jgi:hypothetical protein
LATRSTEPLGMAAAMAIAADGEQGAMGETAEQLAAGYVWRRRWHRSQSSTSACPMPKRRPQHVRRGGSGWGPSRRSLRVWTVGARSGARSELGSPALPAR